MDQTLLTCTSALLTLNRFELSVEPRPVEAHDKDIFQSRAALGVQSVLRMIVDGAWHSLRVSNADAILVPIWCLHRAYAASVVGLELGCMGEDREKETIYIQFAKHMLGILEPGCKLAGIIVFIHLRSMTKQSLTSFRRLSKGYREC
jgi:hypothetical protein